jgi:hypothetical protein
MVYWRNDLVVILEEQSQPAGCRTAAEMRRATLKLGFWCTLQLLHFYSLLVLLWMNRVQSKRLNFEAKISCGAVLGHGDNLDTCRVDWYSNL